MMMSVRNATYYLYVREDANIVQGHACTFVKGAVKELIMRAADEINAL